MTTNKKPIFASGPQSPILSIGSGEGTALQTFFTAGADGAILSSITVASTDTAVITINLTMSDGTDDILIGSVDVPIGAGTVVGNPGVNLLDRAFMPGLQADGSLPIEALHILKLSAASAATGVLTFVGIGGQYAV